MIPAQKIREIAENIESDLVKYRYANNAENEVEARKWVDLVRAKLSIINIIGGMRLAHEICDVIELREEAKCDEHSHCETQDVDFEEENNECLYLTGAFDHMATGVIDGWVC